MIHSELPGDSEQESRKRLFIKTFEEPERCSIDHVVEPGRVRKWGEYVQSLGRKIEVSSRPWQLLNQISVPKTSWSRATWVSSIPRFPARPFSRSLDDIISTPSVAETVSATPASDIDLKTAVVAVRMAGMASHSPGLGKSTKKSPVSEVRGPQNHALKINPGFPNWLSELQYLVSSATSKALALMITEASQAPKPTANRASFWTRHATHQKWSSARRVHITS